MTQLDALALIAANPGGCIWLGMSTRGSYAPYDAATMQTIPSRVWERLLDLGDVDIVAGMFESTNDKWLQITPRGRSRLEAVKSPGLLA